MLKNWSLLSSVATFAILAVPSIATADDAKIEALQKQIELMQQELSSIKAQQADTKVRQDAADKRQEEALTEADLKGTMPGSFRIPGTNTSVKIGGHIKLDGTYDIGAPSGATTTFTSIPLSGGDDRSGQFGLTVRSSRLNFSTETPFDGISVRSLIEFDFQGTGGTEIATSGVGPRLRHAYVTAGPFTIGQTWTTLYDTVAAPEKFDQGGLPAETALRQPQIRYTYTDGPNSLAVALENPESDFIGLTAADTSKPTAVGSAPSPNLDKMPEFITRYTHTFDWGHLSGFALARQISVDNGIVEDSVFGYGLGASGVIKFLGKDKFGFQIMYGDGAGRYLSLFEGQSASFDGTKLNTLVSWGGNFTVQHRWDEMFRTNLTLGYVHIDNDDAVPTSANKEVLSFHGNVIATVFPPLDVGIEYAYGQRETEDGRDADASRVQASMIYRF